MLPTGISTSGASTDFSLGSSTLDTSAAGPKQDTTQQTETGKPSHFTAPCTCDFQRIINPLCLN